VAARTPRQRGIGQWLIEQRVERGWKTAEIARRELLRLGGIKVDKSTYASSESGKIRPADERLRQFAEFYGSEPTTGDVPAPPDLGALVTALNRQAAAMERIVDLLTIRLAPPTVVPIVPESERAAVERAERQAGTSSPRLLPDHDADEASPKGRRSGSRRRAPSPSRTRHP
jgi:transcriptional regulator with XRE-family HTH domain